MSDEKSIAIGFGSILIGLILIWVVCSYFEKTSYNEVTGKNVTLKQAMFLQFRIVN